MKRFIKFVIPLLILLVPILYFFYPVWGQGKNAIPADTLTGLYHPFRDLVSDEYPNGTPFKNFLITDSVRQQYVYRQFSISQLKAGEVPWWNPYNFSGTPIFASFQAAAYYPLNIIFWFTSFTRGWNILVMLQMVLSSLFMYWYLNNLKLHKVSAMFGAIAWIFSGFMVVWLEWNTAVHVALWSPFILLCIDKVFEKEGRAFLWNLLLAFGLIAQFYAGYPQPWLYLSLLQGSYLLMNAYTFGKQKGFRRPLPLVSLVVSYTLFALVALPQLTTSLEFSDLSNRKYDQGNLLEKSDWFIPMQQLIQVIIPDFYGNPATLNYWGVFNYVEFVSYIGVIPFFWALVSLVSVKKNRREYFFTGALIIGLTFALRNPVGLLPFKQDWPFLGASQPSRLIVILDLCLSVLAAIGVDSFIKKKSKAIAPIVIQMIIFGVIWSVLLNPSVNWLQLVSNKSVALRNSILPTLEFGVLLFWLLSMLVITKLPSKLKQNSLLKAENLVLLLLLVVMFSGVRFAQKFTPFTDPAYLYPKTQVTTYLQENQGLQRYMTTDDRILLPNVNLAYGLYTIEGYDPLYSQDYGKLIQASKSQDLWPTKATGFNRLVKSDSYDSKVIDLLGVSYILTFDDLSPEYELVLQEGITKIYKNPKAYPRAFLVDSLESLIPASYRAADIVEYKPNRVVVQTKSEVSTFLILTDTWYPNWQVMIDNQPATLINWYGLRATMVPEGNHEVIYHYRYTYL